MGPHPGLTPATFVGPHVVLGMEPVLAAVKASALPIILSLWPLKFSFLISEQFWSAFAKFHAQDMSVPKMLLISLHSDH